MVFEYNIAKDANMATITLKGELIEKNQANDLVKEAEELSAAGCNKWAIDIGELKYMNSNGLNTLIQLLTKARKVGGEAVLYNLNKKIQELILITKLNTLFKVTETKEEALKILEK
ncbi:MAG: STAS domain-containing protein [Sphingobacteriaceae bacterium]|jgi:anti-anti-sigma factor